MPSKSEILNEFLSNNIDSVRRKYLKKLSEYTKRDTILFASGYNVIKRVNNLPSLLFSISDEDIQSLMASLKGLKNEKLDIIIHSPGGSSEAVEQIVNYLRSKFKHIRAIIPQNAMSAATMLACACDEIIMGKHSALGPIDPQLPMTSPQGITIYLPAKAVFDEFTHAYSEYLKNPNTIAFWHQRVSQYPVGFYNLCSNSIKRAENLVDKWLLKYMFKNDNRKSALTKTIANYLSDTGNHLSHGKPLMIDELKTKGMNITELESDQELQECVLSVYHSTMITFENTSCMKFIENQDGVGNFISI